MNQCEIIRDLLPLYVDDEVSPASRQMIEEHIAGCQACRGYLGALKAPGAAGVLPAAATGDVPPPPEEARFLQRLKRQLGTAVGAGLVLLVLTGLGANYYGRWSRDQELGRKYQAERQAQESALAALRKATPDPMGVLQRRGITLDATAGRQAGGGLHISYSVRANEGVAMLYQSRVGDGPTFTAYDPKTGEPVPLRPLGGQSSYSGGQGQGEHQAEGLPEGAVRVEMEWPVLAASIKAEQPPYWEFRRPADGGEVPIGERFIIGGVEFEVSRLRFQDDKVRIEYRQLTDPAEVGVHYLGFRLSDRLGGTRGPGHLDEITDPAAPYAEFGPLRSPSQNWSLSVEEAILAVPGARITMDVNGGDR